MRKQGMKRLSIALVLLTLMALTAGIAYGYFTDYEEAAGGAEIRLNGETVIREQADDEKKVIAIENTGEADVIVRVAVYGENITVKPDVSSDWIEDGDFWYYNGILSPGEVTSNLTALIDTEAAEAAGHDFDIVVVHEMARVVYDGTEENNVVLPEGWSYPELKAEE